MAKEMISVINLDFDIVLRKQTEYKPIIYNKGKIVGKEEQKCKLMIDKPHTSTNISRIKTAKNLKRGKKFEISVHDIDENQYIGNILSDVFTKEELKNREDISPSAKANIKKAKQKSLSKDKLIKQKIIPLTQAYLRPTTSSNIRSNNIIAFNEEDVLAPSNNANTNSISINDKKSKTQLKSNQKQITKKDLNQTIKRFEECDQLKKTIITIVNEGALSKSANKSILINAQIPQEALVKINSEQNKALEVKAAEDIERIGNECNNLIKYTKDIDFQIKNDMKTLHQPFVRKELDPQKGIELVEGIKEEIKASPTFDVSQLNERDKRLMTSKLNYYPKKRDPIRNLHHNDEKYSDHIKKSNNLLNKSSKMIKSMKENKNKIQHQISNHKVLDGKLDRIKKKGEFDNYFGTAYENLYKQGKKINIKDIQKETNREVVSKEDIYDYVYLKEKESEICYYHPFLADGGIL